MATIYGQFRTLDQVWPRGDDAEIFDADADITELCNDGWEIQHIAVHVDTTQSDHDYVHRVVVIAYSQPSPGPFLHGRNSDWLNWGIFDTGRITPEQRDLDRALDQVRQLARLRFEQAQKEIRDNPKSAHKGHYEIDAERANTVLRWCFVEQMRINPD